MKATIELKRAVEVNATRFQGEVSFLRPQPWEVAVAKTAGQQGGFVSVEDISRQLLGGRQPIARALLQRCRAFGLLTGEEFADIRSFQLTESGRLSAETGEVFVPQSGTWTIWTTEDPMIPEKTLFLERWHESSANEELRQERQSREDRHFISAPGWLREMEGKDLQLPLGKYGNVRITKILDQVEPAGSGDLSLKFCLNSNPTSTTTFLEGTLHLEEGDTLDAEMKPELIRSSPREISTTYEECWQSLLECEGMTGTWDVVEQSLKVKFPDQEDERRTREGSRRFRQPAIPNLGLFDAAVIRNVPLCPATAEDAQLWAEWLLCSKITEYATETKFKRWSDEAGEPFLKWQPMLPDRRELAIQLRPDGGIVPSPKYWHLQTPCDWNL